MCIYIYIYIHIYIEREREISSHSFDSAGARGWPVHCTPQPIKVDSAGRQ